MQFSKTIKTSDEILNRLFLICRSITGNGVRESLGIIKEYIPELSIQEFPTGKQVFDWTIPKEWNIRDAYVKDEAGNRIIDFKKCNVHVMSYSIPVDSRMSFEELNSHLYTLPKLPEAIPYRTSYYKENWGFCLSHNQYLQLDKTIQYEVKIDSSLTNGYLTLGDLILKGKTEEEILISTYCCHPSLANDNLSGVVLFTLLYNELKKLDLKYTYRFVILPETIGAITYLAQNQEAMKKVIGGFVLTTLGGPGKFGYKETFLGNHLIDRAVRLTFRDFEIDYIAYPFVPDGSDERQYSSPGFRIPVSTISKDKYYEYDYYHTSLDNLDFVKSEYLIQSLELYLSAIGKIEKNETYVNLNPNGELQLGKRGLYPETGGAINQRVSETVGVANGDSTVSLTFKSSYKDELDSILWFLFLADGTKDLISISEKTGIPVEQLAEIAEKFKLAGLIK